MSQITISLPLELVERCREIASREGYATLSDFARGALRCKTDETTRPTYWERVILIKLLELENKVTETKNNEAYIETLSRGYISEYRQYLHDIYTEEFDPQKSRLVHEVFACYEDLQDSAQVLNNGKLSKELRFPGYDGNNETDYMTFAEFLVKTQRYAYLDGASENMNSHMPNIPVYQRMLERWREIRASKPRKIRLSKKDIEEILESRIHPLNRK